MIFSTISSVVVLGFFASTGSAFEERGYALCARQALPYDYLGCYTEGTGVRALGAYSNVNYTTMTVESCAGLCVPSYDLFGLEYSGECWCANVFGIGALATNDSDCNMPCAGDSTEICGGSNRLSVYSTALAPPTPPQHILTTGNFTRIGCYTEGNGTRALSSAELVDYTAMTVEECGAYCASNDLPLMGVEYGGECYCGTETLFAASGSTLAPDTDCSMICAGNAHEFCGAGNRLDTYRSS